jgi:hypothetical protein
LTMLYPVLRDMNNWLDNDFDDMLNTSWMPRMNVTAPAINVKENFCVVMSVLINVKAIDSLLIVPPFYVRGILCGRPD